MHITRAAIIGVVGTIALIGAGCKKQAVVQVGPETPRAESPKDAGQLPEPVERDTTGSDIIFGASEQSIPSNFPSDVPRKPGAVFIGSQEAGGIFFTASFRGTGTVTEWTAYYKEALQATGWKLQSSYTINDTSMLDFKKDQRTITMTISKNEENPKEVAAAFLFGTSVPQLEFPATPPGF